MRGLRKKKGTKKAAEENVIVLIESGKALKNNRLNISREDE